MFLEAPDIQTARHHTSDVLFCDYFVRRLPSLFVASTNPITLNPMTVLRCDRTHRRLRKSP
jgi:hypothetical protein